MWWSDRRKFLIALAALPLGACGFRPAFAPGGPAAALLGGLRADDPTDRNGFHFVERLEERLGRPQDAPLELGYTITTSRSEFARTRERGTSRVQVVARLAWVLRRAGDGAELARGEVTEFIGYSTTSTEVANRAAEEDALRRLMRILADRVVTELTATSPDWSAAAIGA